MFVKTAKADSILDLEQTGEFKVRVARRIKADGEAREINFQEILAKTAKKFDISANPNDYIIEVIRANTANVPNENGDGFDKSELLSWAEDEGCPVYMTYVGCPHHINHDSENDKLARGIIIDAHYNDSAPPFDNCKLCGSDTRHASARTDDGIHCIKCGAVAKDEWVEIVVATDRVKDPDLAEAKVAKIVDAGSMGCTALETNCNVCGNLATDPEEFCDHLRNGNKKSWYVIQGGQEPKQIDLNRVRSLLVQAGFANAASIDPRLIYTVNAPGLKIRRATERCKKVRYQEYSAVDRPADPTAEHIEMLKSASEHMKGSTESLIVTSRLRRLEEAVRVLTAQEEIQESDEVPSGEPPGGPVDQDPNTPGTQTPELPPEAEDLPNVTIEEVIEEKTSSDPEEKTFGEWGVLNYDQHSQLPNSQMDVMDSRSDRVSSRLPDQGNLKIYALLSDRKVKEKTIRNKDNQKMLDTITANWKAALTDDGRLAFVDADNNPLFVVKAKKNLKENKAVAQRLASEIRSSLENDGLTFTVRKFKASTFSKLAQIMEDAWVNYEYKPHGKDPGKEPSSSNEEGKDLATQEGYKPSKDVKDTLQEQSETYENPKKRKHAPDTVQESGFANQDDSNANRPQKGEGLSLSTGATATHDLGMQDNSGKYKDTTKDSHFSYSASSHEDELYKQTKEEAESDETAKKKEEHYKKHNYSPGKKIDQMGKDAGADGKGRPTSNLDSVSMEQPNSIDQEQPREAEYDDDMEKEAEDNDAEAEMEKEGQEAQSGVTVNMPDGSTVPVEEYMRNYGKYTNQMMDQTRQQMSSYFQENPDIQKHFMNQNPAAKQQMQNAPGGVYMSPEDEAEFQQSPEYQQMQQQKSGSLTEEQLEVALNKLKRAFTAKADQLEAKYKEKEENLEKEKENAKEAAMESLLRCARIVVKRFELDQEDSPLKYAFRDKIAEEQHVFDGPEGTYEGMPLDLANYLTASAYSEASQDEIDLILERAAELAKADGRYIASLESDLVKQATPELHVKCASMVGNLEHVTGEAVRTALLKGNPVLNSSDAPVQVEDKRSSVKNAIRAFTQAGQFAKTRSGGR